MKKIAVILMVVMVFAFGFSLVSSAADQTQSITIYNSGSLSGDPATALDIKRFEKATGIHVNVIEVPWQYEIDKLTTVFSAKSDKVDAFVGSYFMLTNFAMPNWLVPINYTQEEKARFSPGVLAASSYKGTVYGAPLMIKDTEFYYRKDLLNKAGLDVPKNWDQLVKVAKALTRDTDGDGKIDQYGFGFLGADKIGFTFRTFLYQAGGNMFDQNLKPTFNSEAGVKALTFMRDLVQKYKVTPKGVISMGEGNVGDLFLSGKFAMVEDVPPLFNRVLNSKIADKVDMAVVPEGSENSKTYLDGNVIFVSAFSKNKEAAVKFAKFMSNYKSNLHELTEEGNNSPSPDIFEDASVSDKYSAKWVNVMQKSVKNVKSENYPFYGQVEKILQQETQSAIIGDKSPKQALDAAAKQVKELYMNVLGIQY